MHGYLRQSTASQARVIGPFVDDTDFKALETGLTINASDVKLSKNGAASVNKNSGGGTHIVNGNYALTFDATDTNTVGEMYVSVSVTGALVVVAKFIVLEEAIYDALYAAGSTGFGGGGGGGASNVGEVVFLREYNQSTAIDGITLLDSAGDLVASPTLAAGDVKISIDGAAPVNVGTLPTVTGGAVRLTLASTELQGKRCVITFDDQTAPAEWRSKRLIIETYGNQLGQHAFNLNSLTVSVGDKTGFRLSTDGVADLVSVPYIVEPTTVPAWPVSLSVAMAWMLALTRNQLTQTSSQITLRNDANLADIASATIIKSASSVVRSEWL